jgi:hypothetical protein
VIGTSVKKLVKNNIIQFIYTEHGVFSLDINGSVSGEQGPVLFTEKILKMVYDYQFPLFIGFSGTLYRLNRTEIVHNKPICQVGLLESERSHIIIIDSNNDIYEYGNIYQIRIIVANVVRYINFAKYLDLVDSNKLSNTTEFGSDILISEKFTKLDTPKGIIRLGTGHHSVLLSVNGDSYIYILDPRTEQRFKFLHKDTYSAATPLLLVKE